MKTYTTASSARRALKNALAARNLSLDEVAFEIVPEFGNDGMFIVRVSVAIEGFELMDPSELAAAEELLEAEAIAEVEDAKSDEELEIDRAIPFGTPSVISTDLVAEVGAQTVSKTDFDADFDAEELEAEVAATEAAQPSRRGRPSSLAGKRFTAVVTSNVRRPGSLGHATLALVLANPGATYEELLKMGATPGQLRHDEALQRIKAE